MNAQFERFTLHIKKADALYASHAGNCDQEVADLVSFRTIAEQLDAIGTDLIRAELNEYGAWDDTELADDEQNKHRIVWLACCNIKEEYAR